MRQYEVPEEEARARNKAKASCMRRLLPDVAPERLESVFVEYLKNRSAYLDDALTLCSYLETPAGKWAREDPMIQYKCLRELLPHMPSRARSALSFRMGLDVQEEVVDKFEGILRPEYLHCLSVRRKRPHNVEMLDSSTVYDNPDPQQKLKLCIMHKRSSSEAFMEYRQYRTSAAKEQKRVEDCYNRHLDIPVGGTTISGSAESDVASEASTAVDSEVPADEPSTTVAAEVNEVWSTVVPMTAATSEPDTVRSE
ncbi:uncharacterized protein [Dermacentor andersoni]|uniref:uncharacterized protein isoform X2 n=1 Tax=Dermacentor andersoni TaxID=34620 RepID=UPI002415E7FF|nr:uncharacterized protein LOC126522175 isoform X2 [Dermacentor andersoni]